MRIRLLTLGIVDRVLYALNLKTAGNTVVESDARRVAIIGDDAAISAQTQRSRAFAEEVASKLN
jgi:hypothetical protein